MWISNDAARFGSLCRTERVINLVSKPSLKIVADGESSQGWAKSPGGESAVPLPDVFVSALECYHLLVHQQLKTATSETFDFGRGSGALEPTSGRSSACGHAGKVS
jgi:hypothetical protein